MRVRDLAKAADDPLQLAELLAIVATLSWRIELIEEEHGLPLARVAKYAPQVVGGLA